MAPRVGPAKFRAWDASASSGDGIDLAHPRYTFGFHGASSSGGGPDRRAALFRAYAAGLANTFAGLFDMPVREAWAEANEICEGSGINWAYRRATSPTVNTYGARLRDIAPSDLGSDQTFCTARGSC